MACIRSAWLEGGLRVCRLPFSTIPNVYLVSIFLRSLELLSAVWMTVR